ncbi:MAG: Trm112 family protein [Woeseiaceae bacterium]|nr:Trm112 family protein [Woeseiaceae bacterium]
MDKKLLTILCCPITHKGLKVAGKGDLGKVNSAIEAGNVQNRGGSVLTDELEEALVTDDRKLLYPVRNGIPVLLEGESVNMEQIH